MSQLTASTNPVLTNPGLVNPSQSDSAMTRALPPSSKNAPAATLLDMCSVRVGQTLFGVPIAHILEIVGGTQTQAVPLAPAYVGGLFHYRGDVLTTVSLRNLLGMPAHDGPQDILVIESNGACFGLLVDSVGEVLTVSSENYEPNPSTLDQSRSALFAGAYKLKEKLLVMLDPHRLDPDRLDSAHAGTAAF